MINYFINRFASHVQFSNQIRIVTLHWKLMGHDFLNRKFFSVRSKLSGSKCVEYVPTIKIGARKYGTIRLANNFLNFSYFLTLSYAFSFYLELAAVKCLFYNVFFNFAISIFYL